MTCIKQTDSQTVDKPHVEQECSSIVAANGKAQYLDINRQLVDDNQIQGHMNYEN
jgi:hypothetical protein